MPGHYLRNTILISTLTFIVSFGFAQYATYDAEMLTTLLGKPAEGAEVKKLEDTYHCEMANNRHFISKDGIELMMQDGFLNQVQLYKTSSVYGEFKNQLPHGLSFGMTTAQVKALLGKPVVNYASSGYAEFEVGGFIYACGFDGGKLTELTLSKK